MTSSGVIWRENTTSEFCQVLKWIIGEIMLINKHESFLCAPYFYYCYFCCCWLHSLPFYRFCTKLNNIACWNQRLHALFKVIHTDAVFCADWDLSLSPKGESFMESGKCSLWGCCVRLVPVRCSLLVTGVSVSDAAALAWCHPHQLPPTPDKHTWPLLMSSTTHSYPNRQSHSPETSDQFPVDECSARSKWDFFWPIRLPTPDNSASDWFIPWRCCPIREAASPRLKSPLISR